MQARDGFFGSQRRVFELVGHLADGGIGFTGIPRDPGMSTMNCNFWSAFAESRTVVFAHSSSSAALPLSPEMLYESVTVARIAARLSVLSSVFATASLTL
jgi:hypothetical protein